ncbi:MAG: hypothetical protein ACYTEL_05650 [Planctomycetota bacterium]|jgi:hypothetical protein
MCFVVVGVALDKAECVLATGGEFGFGKVRADDTVSTVVDGGIEGAEVDTG